MVRLITIAGVFVVSSIITGCGGRFIVKPVAQNSSGDGFRYYLPKPFLMVTSMVIAQDEAASAAAKPGDSNTADSKGSPTTPKPKALDDAKAASPGTVVNVKLLWLPDTAHPYSIKTGGIGIGTFKGGLQLSNGWMLTNVSQESDAKVAETITAVSGLISSVLSPGGKSAKSLNAPERGGVHPFLYLFEIDIANHTLTRVDTSTLDSALEKLTSLSGPPLEK